MTQRIIIWGAGNLGEAVYENLCNVSEIVAFADNDISLQGKELHGIKILSLEEAKKIQDIYCIVIASVASSEIYNQISREFDCLIFKDIEKILGFRVSIDISGCCNARCKWCVTGQQNRIKGTAECKFLDLKNFKRIYEHLYSKGIINVWNEIMLYNWGEPFLNPDYLKIIDYLSEKGQRFSISTNASVLKLANNKDAYKTCDTVIFSMPGFSQASYDRIHQFNFERIKNNIVTLIENMRQCGFNGRTHISYHVYKFNMNEIEKAREFAVSNKINIQPIYAYFAGMKMMSDFLTKKMDDDMLLEAYHDLHLQHVENLIKSRPENYPCPLSNIMSINCDGGIELCCCSDSNMKDYNWGSIFEIDSYEQWKVFRKNMLNCDTCKICGELGIDYWICNSLEYK